MLIYYSILLCCDIKADNSTILPTFMCAWWWHFFPKWFLNSLHGGYLFFSKEKKQNKWYPHKLHSTPNIFAKYEVSRIYNRFPENETYTEYSLNSISVKIAIWLSNFQFPFNFERKSERAKKKRCERKVVTIHWIFMVQIFFIRFTTDSANSSWCCWQHRWLDAIVLHSNMDSRNIQLYYCHRIRTNNVTNYQHQQ